MRQPLPAAVAERLEALRNRPIEPTEKGFCALAGGQDGPVTAARLATAKPPLHAAGFSYPLLTLRQAAVRNNVEAMAAYCAAAGVELAPHGKTAMSPELAALQLSHGAWGITVATIGQLATYRAFGFPRLLLANELVDGAGIAWLAAELAADPGFEAYCYVDSVDGVSVLDRVLTAHPAGRPLPVLVEIGHAAGRTGCRTDEAALAVAKAAAATGTLTLAGVAGYEGNLRGATPAQTLGLVGSFCRRLRALADALPDAQGGATGRQPIVTAGGSAYFDLVAAELTAGGGMTVILRSGAYLTHDHGHYHGVSPRRPGHARRPRAAARHRGVGAGAVPARARPGPARRGPPRRRLRPGPAGAAARRAAGRRQARPRRRHRDRAERPARVPAPRQGRGGRPWRPDRPGHLASLHHPGQVADDSRRGLR